MALFTRDPNSFNDSQPLYQIGLQKTILIVGLGNPGKEYDLTRHNIGFYCLDQFASKASFPDWSSKKALHSQLSLLATNNRRVILCKPQTFMNDSGLAVRAVQQFYKIAAEDTLIVHDELDIPFGQVRLRNGGGSAGHNGLKSIIEQGSANAGRVRIGIYNDVTDKTERADFVLSKFSKTEQKQLPALTSALQPLLDQFIAGQPLPADTIKF